MVETTVREVGTAELPALLAAGPVTIRVGDPGDPCGSRRIARVLEAAYPAEVTDRVTGARTVGRWVLVFATPGSLSSLLVTSVDARYAVTVDAPEDSGPCASCVAFAARAAAEVAPVVARVESPFLALVRQAREAGYDAGRTHANYVENVGPAEWSVPEGFAEVAEDYRDAFAEGVAEYLEDHAEA